jgi:TPR repeat protein
MMEDTQQNTAKNQETRCHPVYRSQFAGLCEPYCQVGDDTCSLPQSGASWHCSTEESKVCDATTNVDGESSAGQPSTKACEPDSENRRQNEHNIGASAKVLLKNRHDFISEEHLEYHDKLLNDVFCGNKNSWNRVLQFAADGDLLAQAMVALCYASNSLRIVDTDKSVAKRWGTTCVESLRSQSCDKGCMRAQYYLGQFYFYAIAVDKSEGQGRQHCWLSAKQGYAPAMTKLAVIFVSMPQESFQWFDKASASGFAMAQHGVGAYYEHAKGVARDMVKAVYYYKLAAGQEYAQACLRLGQLNESGGTKDFRMPKNLEASVHLFRIAANQKLAQAQFELGRHYEDSKRRPFFMQEAMRLYRLAAQQGHPEAAVNLGLIFEQGHRKDVRVNMTKALKYYRQASVKDCALGLYRLGECYRTGKGVEIDDSEAIRLVTEAAELGHSDALIELGSCYEGGSRGLSKDLNKARDCFRTAAEGGSRKGVLKLSNLEFECDNENNVVQIII